MDIILSGPMRGGAGGGQRPGARVSAREESKNTVGDPIVEYTEFHFVQIEQPIFIAIMDIILCRKGDYNVRTQVKAAQHIYP